MEINGKAIADIILCNLKEKIAVLRTKGITPHLAIITIGNDPASKAYVRQKKLKAREIGAKVTIKNLTNSTPQHKLLKLLKKLNNDSNVHGIIVQRPLPKPIDEEAVSNAVLPEKDVDGFDPESRFEPPIVKAVLMILEEVYLRSTSGVAEWTPPRWKMLTQWLISQNIIVIGKGETGGGPIVKRFKDLGLKLKVIDSKTKNSELITRNADIIISAVGKNIVTASMIKKGVILISVGIYKGKDGKLHGDYNEDKIKNKAAFYTPTPGGVGPVNVVCLLENLVKAAEKNII